MSQYDDITVVVVVVVVVLIVQNTEYRVILLGDIAYLQTYTEKT